MSNSKKILKQIVEDWRCYLIGVGSSYPPDEEEYKTFFERMVANITDAEHDAKYFSYFKSSDMIEVHFGLFGVVFGKATSKRK